MAKGSDLVSEAARHVGEEYVLGVVAPKDDPLWAGPWDCAELAAWLAYRFVGKLYGCVDNDAPPRMADAYTGAWARDARRGAVGRVSVEEAAGLPGAFLLRYSPRGGHIVVVDPPGTIEAMNRKHGVTRGRIGGRRWDMGILVPGVEYDGCVADVPPPPGVIYRLVWPHMRGAAVLAIQRALGRRGFDPGAPDGVFGPQTQRAVSRFQESEESLVADGEVGPQTAAALLVGLA